MTDRYAGFIVTLANDIREDDAEATLNALRMVRGVLSVTPVNSDIAQHIATERANREIRNAMYAALEKVLK